MEIKTIRGVLFYYSLFLITLLCGGLGTLLVFVALAQETVSYGMLFCALLFLFLLAYAVVKFIKYTPIVRMSDEGIRYRNRRYGWVQITSADFVQQQGFPSIGRSAPMDAITLTFDDGNELCIFDKMYWNRREIRTYLQARLNAGVQVQPEIQAEPIDEVAAKALKKKMNRFVWIGAASVLLVSFLTVFFKLSKGLTLLIMLVYCVLLMFTMIKMIKKREHE